MMALVAYGSSGESENDSDEEIQTVGSDRGKITVGNEAIIVPASVPHGDNVQTSVEASVPAEPSSKTRGDLHSKLPLPKTPIEAAKDIAAEESLELGSMLPAPKHHSANSLLGSSFLLHHDSRNKNKKRTVQIMIPSLSDFPDDEDEPKAKKKIQPSAKGSGLFALLPPPKQGTVKEANRSLVPNVLTRKSTCVPFAKKPIPKHFLKSVVDKKQTDSDPESDGEGDDIDFFSLNKEDKLPDIPVAGVSSEYQDSVTHEAPSTSQYEISSNNHQNELYGHQVEEDAVHQADSGQNYISFSGSADLELDDEAIKKLCGRKGRNREEIQIVDVSGDAIMPDQREWLTKQLTEEQPRRSSQSKLNGPSSQQKRKHQITYLAHIAKENEMELKNQWANNRQTRKQTQSKYGF